MDAEERAPQAEPEPRAEVSAMEPMADAELEDSIEAEVAAAEDASVARMDDAAVASTGSAAAPRGRRAAQSVAAPTDTRARVPNVGLIEPRLYHAHPELQAAWAQAYQTATQGDYVRAAQLLLSIAANTSDADVGSDAAIRAGRHLLKVGDLQGASAALQRSEALSPKSTKIRMARRDLKRQIATVYEP
jgi:hypothetical protein